MAAIAGGSNPLQYDAVWTKRRTGQQTGILDLWRELAGAANLGPGRSYLPGDGNLDGLVNEADFDIWNTNKFTAMAVWSRGDFNADGIVDGSDFGIWNVTSSRRRLEVSGRREFILCPETESILTSQMTSTISCD